MFESVFWLILAKYVDVSFGYPGNKPRFFPNSSADVESFNSVKSAVIEEMIYKELSVNKCRLASEDKLLRDSYFHVNRSGTSVHIQNPLIQFPRCTRITSVKNDIFARRMDLSLEIPALTIKGDVTFDARFARPEDKYPLRWEINNLRGSGLCFTNWTGPGYEIIACDIHYEKNFDGVKLDTRGYRLPMKETVFVTASMSRLWKGVTNAINVNVIERLNLLMREMDVMKFLRNPDVFQKYKNYVIESTESANEFVDGIMGSVRKLILVKFGDKVAIPNIEEGFQKKILVVTWRGSFTADRGTVRGLSTVARVGDTSFATDNASQTHFFGNLSFEKLNLHYDRYKAEFMSFGPTGTLDTKLEPIRLHIHPYVNFNTGKIYLEDFEIEDVGEIVVEVTGLGTVLNWIVSKITTWVAGLTRDRILEDLQKKYDRYIKSILSGYTVREIIDGKAFDRP